MSIQPNCQKRMSNESYCKFGADVLTRLIKVLEDQIEDVTESKDVEAVHKMRVASRRIRAVMPLFEPCFPEKKFKKWLREVKIVTRSLGEARDLDVQIAFVEGYVKSLSSASAGLELLLKNHKDRRLKAQVIVVEKMKELRNSNVLPNMTEFCRITIEESSQVSFDSLPVLEKTSWQLTSRLNDFLAMEEWVHQEKEYLKHHATRIRAKWLRYTMEVFSPLFEGKLEKEIEKIKGFQDVLGEMHDCDVWVEYIPKFTNAIKSKAAPKEQSKTVSVERSLSKFVDYVKKQRKSHYKSFVKLWDETKADGFFEKLKETVNLGVTLGQSKAKELLSKPDARIAVFADIHANLHALEAVIQDVENRDVHLFINAGDLIGFGAFPNEVIELLQEKNVFSIAGNYDLEVIGNYARNQGEKKLALEFTRKELAESSRNYIRTLPQELRLTVSDKKLLVVHGSPESIEEHVYHNTPIKRLKELGEKAKADLVVMGHSHEQFWRKVEGVSFINPGSVGRPGDGKPQAAYAIVSFNPVSIELLRVDYDNKAATEALRKKRLPESFAQMLLRGVALDTILEEDHTKKNVMVQSCRETVKNAEKVSKNYWIETEHYKQVRKLALSLYDGLSGLHELGARERCWLECAAVLHDIGLSKGVRGHNKTSLDLILNNTQLPFTSTERRVIGSIARYHRKGFPKKKHYNLATLSRATIQKTIILSSILRLADALDYTHNSLVEALNVRIGPKRVIVECVAHSDATFEEQAFNKKKDYFEKTFKKKLVLLWKQH